MSDEIIINEITTENNIVVNEITSDNNISLVSAGSLVTSVNNKVGAVVLNKSDVGLDQVDNTSDLNKPLPYAVISVLTILSSNSANWNLAYQAVSTVNTLSLSANYWNLGYQAVSTVNTLSLSANYWNTAYSLIQTNSAINWNYQGTDLKGLSANWQSTYITVSSLSANWNSVYSTVYYNSGGWGNSGGGSAYITPAVSGIWQSSASTVSSLSANWNLGYQAVSTTNALALSSIYWNTAYSLVSGGIVASFSLPQSANWQSTYITVSSLSANWNSVYTTFNANSGSLTILSSNSANWNLAYQAVSTVNTLGLSSVYWNTAYNLIQSNSAINWNYQGTDLKGLSANWQTAYQSVSTTNLLNLSSAYWNTAYTIGTTYQNASGSFITAVNGTPNQITASKFGSIVTLSLPTSAAFPGDVSIQGNLIISGSATYINANNLIVNDNLIYFAAANTANILDLGIVGHFTHSTFGYNHSGLIRRAGGSVPGVWTLFSGLTSEPLSASNIDWADPNIRIDSLSANLIGNVTGNATTVTNGVYTTDTGTVTNTMLAGSIADNKISSSSSWNTAYQSVSTTNLLNLSSIYWNNVYTIGTTYQSASGSFATNTLLQSTSALLTPLTTTNTLTSQLVLNTTLNSLSGNWQSTYTTFNSNSGALTIVTSNSANWQTAYQSVSTTSLLNLSSIYWNNVYSTVYNTSGSWGGSSGGSSSISSAVSGIWQSTASTVSSLSANWSSVYTTFNANSASLTILSSNSANWNFSYNIATTYSKTSALYLPLSGGQLTGALTTTSTISALSGITGFTIATNSQFQFLTGGSFVKVYQFYNSTTNSLDTVFN